MDPVLWNRRVSLVYAVGVWTLIGFGYYKYRSDMNRSDVPVEVPIEEEDNKPNVEEDNRPNVKKYETTHSKTTIVFKENFVPYSTRFLNLFRSTNESEKHEEEK